MHARAFYCEFKNNYMCNKSSFNMSKKIAYVKQDEPSFIKNFKQKVGYKEDPDIDAKRTSMLKDVDDWPEGEDDQPTVVVLKKGDLTSEEAEEHIKTHEGTSHSEPQLKRMKAEEEDEGCGSEVKIFFRKPVKRTQESDLNFASTKKSKDSGIILETTMKSSQKLNNKKLLSFNEDEDDDCE